MNRNQARKNQSQKLQKVVKEAIEVLDDYWIYDTAQLLQDGAVATARIARLLNRIRRKPHRFMGRERELANEVSELVRFLKDLDQEAARNVRLSFSCPDGVEEHLKNLAHVVDSTARIVTPARDPSSLGTSMHRSSLQFGSRRAASEPIRELRKPISLIGPSCENEVCKLDELIDANSRSSYAKA
ncbi:hypothetical protein [Bradyrhizobium sp. URHD0069]|uniref:hypothetical protein n=1 Tax=Bradyrhizobium sp. URHD0069 TaxID=1380355 RepID=UPI0012DEDA8D|nr:hypothetical protein [Bradyrhizobium sp. URHD0069]